VGLKSNGIHQLLAYADVNLLGDNIDTTNKNTKTLIDANKGVGLEVNGEKIKYMLVPCCQNADQNRDVKIANRLFENLLQFRYLGTTIKQTNKQTPWPLVRERTIPTDRPPLVDEI
jgi:hypothetical protein